ncbi:hypothetical protein [Roseomonas sp. WA12]
MSMTITAATATVDHRTKLHDADGPLSQAALDELLELMLVETGRAAFYQWKTERGPASTPSADGSLTHDIRLRITSKPARLDLSDDELEELVDGPEVQLARLGEALIELAEGREILRVELG